MPTTWIEWVLDRSPFGKKPTAILLVAIFDIIFQPILTVPVFSPGEMRIFLYQSGIEFPFCIAWSALALILIAFLYLYPRHLKRNLDRMDELTDSKTAASRTRIENLLFGRVPTYISMVVFLGVSGLVYFFVQPAMIQNGWYQDAPVRVLQAFSTSFNYSLMVAMVWLLGTYALVVHFSSKSFETSPVSVEKFREFMSLGAVSKEGVLYLSATLTMALVYVGLSKVVNILWWSPVPSWILIGLAVISLPCYFLASTYDLHRVAAQTKEIELSKLYPLLWSEYRKLYRMTSVGNELPENGRAALSIGALQGSVSLIEGLPSWPFDLATIRDLAIAVLVPVLVWASQTMI